MISDLFTNLHPAFHTPVGEVEGLLNPIPVMDVDVDVQNARVVLQ